MTNGTPAVVTTPAQTIEHWVKIGVGGLVGLAVAPVLLTVVAPAAAVVGVGALTGGGVASVLGVAGGGYLGHLWASATTW